MEEEIRNNILNIGEHNFYKVARVFGSAWTNCEANYGKIEYSIFEKHFFNVLNNLIDNKLIIGRGTIEPDNMRFSEIKCV